MSIPRAQGYLKGWTHFFRLFWDWGHWGSNTQTRWDIQIAFLPYFLPCNTFSDGALPLLKHCYSNQTNTKTFGATGQLVTSHPSQLTPKHFSPEQDNSLTAQFFLQTLTVHTERKVTHGISKEQREKLPPCTKPSTQCHGSGRCSFLVLRLISSHLKQNFLSVIYIFFF